MLKVFVLFGKKLGFIFYQDFYITYRKISDNLFSAGFPQKGVE
jgi:hypothetical protein